jgi:hypothetical protein
MNSYFAFQIDIVDLIKSCESESALEFLEQSFVLEILKSRTSEMRFPAF